MALESQLAVDQPIRNKAFAWSMGIHALLILLFIFLKYSTPLQQPVEELGLEVNLGTSDEGSGDDQPMDMDDPAPAVAVRNARAATSQQSNDKEIMESDDADAPVIHRTIRNNDTRRNTATNNTNRTIANTRNTPSNTNNTVQQTQRPRYVYSGATGNGGNSAASNQSGTSEGNTTGDGDRGVPGGTPGASNYTGSPGQGSGGISHTLVGRDISPKRFSAEFNEGGKVVIRIKVDRNGNIISKTVKSSPSSTLSKIALQKLSQAKFSASPNAAPEQFGDITIVFKTRS
jgi:TonB family protein